MSGWHASAAERICDLISVICVSSGPWLQWQVTHAVLNGTSRGGGGGGGGVGVGVGGGGVSVCVCVCVRACVHACVRVRVRVCVLCVCYVRVDPPS